MQLGIDVEIIGQAIIRLLQLWKLSPADQLQVLGFPFHGEAMLSRLATDRSFPSDGDQLARVSHLIAIHRTLEMLYPENPESLWGWMKFRNAALGGKTPLEVVKDKGLHGLALVRAHLEQRLNH